MSYAPYLAYKDTRGVWLDKIPSHWDARPLKYDIGLQNGAAFKPTEWSQTGTPIIRIENLNGGGEFNCFEGEIHPRYVIQKGDVLFGWSGNRGTSFGPFRWEKEGRYYLNQHIFKIEHQNLDQGWLYWALRAVTSYIESEAHGIIGMVHITKQKLGNIFLPVVPIEEQTAIADFLDKKTAEIDDLIAKKEGLLRLLAEQRTALITHAVTKGLTPNAPMKSSGVVWFDQVPAHWQVRRLKDVGTLTGGAGFPHEFQNIQGEELYFYKVGDLAKSEDGIHLTSAPHTISRENAAKLRATVIPPDAILYAKIGAALLLNRRRISTANCCIDNNMTAWIVDPSKVLPLWGFYWMSTVDFGEHTNPGAVPSLSEGYQSILPITLPPLDEQQAIVDQLTNETKAIDQTAQKTREAIEHLLEYRTALITNAVTGKIKVA